MKKQFGYFLLYLFFFINIPLIAGEKNYLLNQQRALSYQSSVLMGTRPEGTSGESSTFQQAESSSLWQRIKGLNQKLWSKHTDTEITNKSLLFILGGFVCIVVPPIVAAAISQTVASLCIGVGISSLLAPPAVGGAASGAGELLRRTYEDEEGRPILLFVSDADDMLDDLETQENDGNVEEAYEDL